MRKTDCPLVVAYGYPLGLGDFEFMGRHGLIQFIDCQKDLLKILPFCNGIRSLEEISKSIADVDSQSIIQIIRLCEHHGLVVGGRKLYQQFHADSSNPSRFPRDLSPSQIEKLQRHSPHICSNAADEGDKINSLTLLDGTTTYKSVRFFLPQALPKQLLLGLLGSMYRVQATHSVPSAGALYPLKLYTLVLRESGGMSRGSYIFDSRKLQLERFADLPVMEEIYRVFDTRELFENAAVIVVVTGGLDRSSMKYGNRGYRYTLLEAGHVAQNACLFCATTADHRIGLVEYGGFLDEYLAKLLCLRYPQQAPIISLICGVPSNETVPLKEIADRENVRVVRQKLVGKDKPVAAVGLRKLAQGNLTIPRWVAVAEYHHPQHMTRKPGPCMRAYATGPLFHEAVVKVISEAYERHVCYDPMVTTWGSAASLKTNFIDPNKFAPYLSDHPVYQRYRLTQFVPEQERGWLTGHFWETTNKIMVPCDMIFFEKPIRQGVSCYRPNSSGVAAHPNSEVATENAFLELVERDALAVTWFSRKVPVRIMDEALPSDIFIRKTIWEKQGWAIHILNITLEWLPVCLVLFINHQDEYPSVASGAGCCVNLSAAIEKAFVEAEYMALSWRSRRNKKLPVITDVYSPDQHGLLYASGQYRNELDHLLDAPFNDSLLLQGDLKRMVLAHNPVVIRMDGGKYPLKVVRVLSESLLPLTFGFATEHYGHPRLLMLGLKWDRSFPSIPHFFP
ncbi:MAG: YcaO-like family protein [Patescibacteria group bacterium]